MKTETKAHFVMTICTLGMWLPFWAIISLIEALWPKKKRKARPYRVAAPREAYDAAYRDWYYNQYLPWAKSQQYVNVPDRKP